MVNELEAIERPPFVKRGDEQALEEAAPRGPSRPPPTAPAPRPRFDFLPDELAAPRVQAKLDPAGVPPLNFVEQSKNALLDKLNVAISDRYALGPVPVQIVDAIATSDPYDSPVSELRRLTDIPNEDLVSDFASLMWDALPEGEKSRFIGVTSIFAETLGGQFQRNFNELLQAGDERRLFGRTLTGIIKNPELATPEILGIYFNAGIIAPSYSEKIEEPLTAGAYLVNDGRRQYAARLRQGLKDTTSQSMAEALFPPYRVEQDEIRRLDNTTILQLVEMTTTAYNEAFNQEVVKVGQSQLKALETARPDAALRRFSPEELFNAIQIYTTLSSLPYDDLVEALKVTPREVASNVGAVPTASYALRERAHALTAAEQYWRSLGLDPIMMKDLTALILEGPREIDPTTIQLRNERARREDAQNAIHEWIAINGDATNLPITLVFKDLIDVNFLTRVGVSPDRATELVAKAPSSRGVSPVGMALSPIGAGLAGSAPANFLGHLLDHERDVLLSYVTNVAELFDQPIEHSLQRIAEDPSRPVQRHIVTSDDSSGLENTLSKIGGLGYLVDFSTFYKLQGNPEESGYLNIDSRSLTNGPIRRRFNEIWVGATPEQQEAMRDSAASLLNYRVGFDGKARLLGMNEFNTLVGEGMSIEDAASIVREGSDILALAFGGLDNLIFAGAGVAVDLFKGSRAIRLSRSRFTHIPSGSNLGELNPTVLDEIIARRAELEVRITTGLDNRAVQLNDKVKTWNTSINGVSPEEAERVVIKGLRDRDLRRLSQERDEIDRILESGGNTVTTIPIHHASDELDLIVPGDFRNKWKVIDPYERAMEPASEFKPFNWDRLQGTRLSQLRQWDWNSALRHSKAGQAAAANMDALQAHRQVGALLSSGFRNATEGDAALLARGILNEFKVAADQGLAGLRSFITRTKFSRYLTNDMRQAGEIFRRVDLDSIDSLKQGVKVARNPEEVAQFRQAIEAKYPVGRGGTRTPAQERALEAELEKIYPNHEMWFAEFNQELLDRVGVATHEIYGTQAWDKTIHTRLQRTVNGFLSRAYLSYPGFVTRNVGSNTGATALDGINPLRLVFNKAARETRNQYLGGPFARIGLSATHSSAPNIKELAEQSRSLRKAWRHKGVLGGALGDGLPFMGGLPFVSFRGLSSFFEGWHRDQIMIYEFDRLMKNVWQRNADAIFTSFLTGDGRPFFEANPALKEKLVSAMQDPFNTDTNSMLGLVHEAGVDRFFLEPNISAEYLAKQLGVNPGHLLPEQWSAFTEVINDPLTGGQTAVRRMMEFVDEIDKVGLERATLFGIPDEVHTQMMGIVESAYGVARDTGLSAEIANDVAMVMASQITKRMQFVFGQTDDLLGYLRSPELYRNTQFGFVRNLNDIVLGPEARAFVDDLLVTNPIPDGYRRLYRVDSDAIPPELLSSFTEPLATEGIAHLPSSRLFTEDPDLALKFVGQRGLTGHLSYVDIGDRTAATYALTNNDGLFVVDEAIAGAAKQSDQFRNLDIMAGDDPLSSVLYSGIQNNTRSDTLHYLAEQEAFQQPAVYEHIFDYARKFEGDTQLMAQAEETRKTLRELQREVSRYENTKIGRPRDGVVPADLADLKTRGIWDPSPDWSPRQRSVALDRAIDRIARLVPSDFRFVVRPQGSRLMNMFEGTATEGELRSAVIRAIQRGDVQQRFKNVRGRIGITRTDILTTKTKRQLDALVQRFGNQMREYSDSLSGRIVEANRGNIDGFVRDTNSSWRELMTTMSSDVNSQFAVNFPDWSPEIRSGVLSELVEKRLQDYSDKFITDYNEIAEQLLLPPMSPLKRDAALVAGKWPMDELPQEYSRWVVENAPWRNTALAMSPGVEDLRAARSQVFAINNARNVGVADRSEEVLEWAKSVPSTTTDWRGGIIGSYNLDRRLPTVVIDDDSLKVVPATYGLPEFTPGVWGHGFMRKAPDGWKPFITDDTYGIGANRMALYVRDDATQDEIRQVATDLKRVHNRAVNDKRIQDRLRGAGFTGNQREQNPLGYHASFLRETEEDIRRQLAPIVRIAEDTANVDSEVALQVLAYAKKQRVEGWPIVGETPDAFRSIDDVFTNFKAQMRLDSVEQTLGVVTREQADDIVQALTKLAQQKNETVRIAYEMAAARGDWVLHNYTNTNDLDWMLSHITPWHIWPTRTAAKMAVLFANNPKLGLGLSQYLRTMEQLNKQYPEYLRDQIPIPEWALGGLQRLGLIDPNSTGVLNPSGPLFWLDMFNAPSIRNFVPNGDRDFNALGRFIDKADVVMGPLGLSPIFTTLGAAFGAFGDQYSPVDAAANTQIRRLNALTTVVSEGLENFGVEDFPRYGVTTKRDLYLTDRQFAIMVVRALEAGDLTKMDNLIEGWDRWSSTDKLGVGEQLLINGVTGTEYADIIDEVVGAARKNETTATLMAMLTGVRPTFVPEEWAEMRELLNEYGDLRSASFENDAERQAAYAEVAERHPWVKRYYIGLTYDGTNMVDLARDDHFAGWGEIQDKYDGLMTSALLFPETGEDWQDRQNLDIARSAEEDAHQKSVMEKYGIGEDDAETLSRVFDRQRYTLSYPEVEAALNQYTGLDAATIQQVAVIETAIRKLFGPRNGRVLSAEQLRTLFEDPDLNELFFHNPHLLTSRLFNRYVISDVATDKIIRYTAETDPSNFPAHKRTFGDTNAVDWDARQEVIDTLNKGMTQAEQDFLRQVRTRNLSLDNAIKGAYQEIVNETIDVYWRITRLQTDDPLAKAESIERLMGGFGVGITPAYVYNKMMETYGEIWRTGIGESDTEVLAAIKESLEDLDPNLFNLIDGRIERGLQRVASDLREVEAGTREAGEVRHYQMPTSGYIITDLDEVELAFQALDLNKELVKLRDNGISTGFLIPTASDVIEAWYRMFWKDGEERITRQNIIDAIRARGSKSATDIAFALIDYWQGEGVDPVLVKDGEQPVGGVKSSGRDPTRASGTYWFGYLGANPPKSQAGQILEGYLNSKFFTGQFADNAPPSYVYEYLAHNGISTSEGIQDFFWSVYNTAQKVYDPIFAKNQDIQNVLLESQFGDDGKVPTFRYILGIKGLVQSIHNVGDAMKFSLLPTVVVEAPRRAGAPSRATSRSGVGGLPQWDEVINWTRNVFHNDAVVLELTRFFTERNFKFSRTVQVQLRYMFKFFDVGIDVTFDQWLEALKLMWQTSSLGATTIGTQTVVNPAGRGFARENPRIARF